MVYAEFLQNDIRKTLAKWFRKSSCRTGLFIGLGVLLVGEVDEGLDDRILEIMKVFAIAELQKNFPDLSVMEIYFNKEEDGSHSFAVKFDNNEWGRTDIDKKSYDQVAESFKIPLAVNDEYLIDTEWALSVIEKEI